MALPQDYNKIVISDNLGEGTAINAAIDGFLVMGYDRFTTSGLNWYYYGGDVSIDSTISTIADGFIALTDNDINYIYISNAAVVTKSLIGYEGGIPIAQITTATGAITEYIDKRTWIGQHDLTGYLKLDQTTPQTVINGLPIFDLSLKIDTLTAGQVLFAGANKEIEGDDNFKWDKTLNKLTVDNEIITSSGALTITPASGSGLNINLATTGDLAVNTNQFYVDTSTGNIGIGTVGSASARVDVVGSTASDLPTYSAEFLLDTGWTSTDWTGDFATGWTHTTGNTTALSQSKAAVATTKYQIAYTVTGRTAGTFTIAFGGQTSLAISATGAWGPTATTTDSLVITPTSTFNGKIVISIKSITAVSTPLFALKTSTNAKRTELRAPLSNADVAIGRDALGYQTTGFGNVAVGYQSLLNTTTGYQNVAVGEASLKSNTTGVNNMAIGNNSLSANTIGNNNLAIGTFALLNSVTSGLNVAIGTNAGRYYNGTTGNLTTIDNSIFIGYGASSLANSETNEIVIGYNAIGEGSNSVVLGNSSIATTRLRGVVTVQNSIATTGSTKLVIKSGAGQSTNTLEEWQDVSANIMASMSQTVFTSPATLQLKNGTKFNSFTNSGSQSAGTLAYTLPSALPAVTGYVLSSTDAGVMSWVGIVSPITEDSTTFSIRRTNEGGTGAPGNTRAAASIDLQYYKTSSDMVSAGIYSTISGGKSNKASGELSTISGGENNTVSGLLSIITGGDNNLASGDYSIVSGGRSNTSSGASSIIFGGNNNVASGENSIIIGGGNNIASVQSSCIFGGGANAASGIISCIVGGSNNIASGVFSFIAGGEYCTASGQNSFAAGSLATASHNYSFCFADGTSTATDRNYQFKVGAAGGVKLRINNSETFEFYYTGTNSLTHSSGAVLTTGGVWTDASSRELKIKIADIDPANMLKKVMKIKPDKWQYKSESANTQHIGLYAEDFYNEFKVGNDKGLGATDLCGVLWSAVQALSQQLDETNRQLDKLSRAVFTK